MMKYLLTMLCALAFLVSCHDDDTPASSQAKRTVLVYMSAENNLSSNASMDINEMVRASETLPDNVNLVAFVDKADKNNPPYIIQIKKGQTITDDSFLCTDDFYACDPEKMRDIISHVMSRYPADSYGLVLWGHASGWLIENDTIAYGTDNAKMHKAYGVDYGNNTEWPDGRSKYINIPTLAKVLESLPHELKFILADCCNFQCVEVAYELRNATEYIIGSPAEIPENGAPYDRIVPYMFSTDDDFYRGIVDEYNADAIGGDRVPMSVIRTDELENLAMASREVIDILMQAETIDTEGIIYYRGTKNMIKLMCDMNDIVMRTLSETTAYENWKLAFDRTVVYKILSKKWTAFGNVRFDFDVTEDRYGGVSMFVPQPIYDVSGYDYNQTIKNMQWYYASGMCDYK